MKPKLLFPILHLVGLLVVLPLLAPEATAQTKQEAAILDVVRAKTDAYFAGDLKKWQSFWIQDSSSSRAIVSKFGYSSQTGWPNVLAELTKNSQEDGVHSVTVAHENVHIRTSGKLAFVEADERQSWPDIDPKLTPKIHTYTVLVQENTGWKIANQVRVSSGTFANTPTNREYELNSTGYDLLKEKRLTEAIDVFSVNVKLNPNSWNAYDSLGEAYALAGDTKSAITHYEKSVVLNPGNESGVKALAKLKKL